MAYAKKHELAEILVNGGKKKQKSDLIENYVWRYYVTDIVTIDVENFTVELNTNGWETTSTKERINAALAALNVRAYITQHDYVWYLKSENGTIKYFDGVKISLIDMKVMN